jgi:hypothetical protein
VFASVSLIAVGAFILTLAVVTYEVIMLKKKKSLSPQTVQLPDYQQDPKAVQTMTSVANVSNPDAPQIVQAEAPMQARSLPSMGKMIALGGGLIVVVLLIAGAFFLNSRRTEHKITQANVETSEDKNDSKTSTSKLTPKPTKAELIVQAVNSPTPTTVITIAIVSSTNQKGANGGDKGSTDSSSLEPTISLAASPSAVLTQKTTISPTKSSELPKSGIVQESLILGAISVFFIALAFVL